MTLQDYTRRAAVSQNESFIDGPANVTVLAYFFREPELYDEKFIFLRGALLETWRKCGRMKTVVVSNAKGASLSEFANEFPWVEVQEDHRLIPGDIDSMSIDCISRLWSRFDTEYVLIVQDDGFPLRSGIEEFLRYKYDFYGAPFCRNKILPQILNRLLHFAPMNGGFSIRSHSMCLKVSRLWGRYYNDSVFCPDYVEDNFYTNFLPRRHPLFALTTSPAPCNIASRFSYDASFDITYLRSGGLPFGFHNVRAFGVLAEKFPCELAK